MGVKTTSAFVLDIRTSFNPGVTFISPLSAPRILDTNVLNGTIFTAMSYSENSMIRVGSAFIGANDTSSVKFEIYPVSLDQN